jgi:hypothetical protein
MNPNLVPQAVNVVIGENLYELKFRVELDPIGSNPQLMEMDSEQESGRRNPRIDADSKGTGAGQHMGQNSKAEGQSGKRNGNSGSISKDVPNILLPTVDMRSHHTPKYLLVCGPQTTLASLWISRWVRPVFTMSPRKSNELLPGRDPVGARAP